MLNSTLSPWEMLNQVYLILVILAPVGGVHCLADVGKSENEVVVHPGGAYLREC